MTKNYSRELLSLFGAVALAWGGPACSDDDEETTRRDAAVSDRGPAGRDQGAGGTRAVVSDSRRDAAPDVGGAQDARSGELSGVDADSRAQSGDSGDGGDGDSGDSGPHDGALARAKSCKIACDELADCAALPVRKKCKMDTKDCVECLADPDCAGASLGRNLCGPLNSCVACKTSADCAGNPAGEKCALGRCARDLCTGDEDCIKGPGNTGKCQISVTGLNTCTRCTVDTDCVSGETTISTGKCDTSEGSCSKCTADADCSTIGLVCDEPSGKCVVCAADADCTGRPNATARCVAGTCSGCDDVTDCTAVFDPDPLYVCE